MATMSEEDQCKWYNNHIIEVRAIDFEKTSPNIDDEDFVYITNRKDIPDKLWGDFTLQAGGWCMHETRYRKVPDVVNYHGETPMYLIVRNLCPKDVGFSAYITIIIKKSNNEIYKKSLASTPESRREGMCSDHTPFKHKCLHYFNLGISRDEVLKQKKELLDNGTLYLSIVVQPMLSLEHTPKNPLQSMLLSLKGSPEDSDIVFHFQDGEPIPGHRVILNRTAKKLVELYQDDDQNVPTIIQDLTRSTFMDLLHYAYGGDMTARLDQNNNDKCYLQNLISAANRYEMVPLKIIIETHIVRHNIITMDNVIDWSSYAAANCCALLRESTRNFLLLTTKHYSKSTSNKTNHETSRERYDHYSHTYRQNTVDTQREKLRNIYGPEVDSLDAYQVWETADTSQIPRDIDDVSVSKLRAELDKRNLDVDGPKNDLHKRLKLETQKEMI